MDVSGRVLGPGALGQILSRQMIILRLARSEVCLPYLTKTAFINCFCLQIAHPAFLPGVKASLTDFKARLLYLDLSMAEVSTRTLTDLLSKCSRLKKISLEHVPVNDEVLSVLSLSKDIEVINFAMVSGITKEGIAFLLKNCKK